MLAINLAGGVAVLGSYAWGLGSHPELRGAVWGGVPEALRPLYTVSMLAAAAGYFAFTGFLFFGVDPEDPRVPFARLNALYVLILLPSAFWMPLTLAMLESPSGALWLVIRAVLAAVGIGSLGLLWALLRLRPQPARGGWRLAVTGLGAFSFQTALLDALVWPAYFPA